MVDQPNVQFSELPILDADSLDDVCSGILESPSITKSCIDIMIGLMTKEEMSMQSLICQLALKLCENDNIQVI